MTRIATPARRALWVLAVLCAALVLAAVVLVLARPAAAPLPAGSPQASVQQYTAAYLDGDWEVAQALSAQPAQTPCNDPGSTGQMGVDLLSTQLRGERATVQVRLTEAYLGGPFSLAQGGYQDQFELRRVDGTWKVSTAPWMLAMCPADELGPLP